MTVITIRTEDHEFLNNLNLWLKKNTPKVAVETEYSTEINWTDARLDAKTERLVWESIARNEANISLNSPSIKEVFYDL